MNAASFAFDPMIPFNKLEIRSEEGVLLGRREVEDDDLYCHLIDAEGAAFCFADITGRVVHDAGKTDSGGRYIVCGGCGRARCPKCVKIDSALSKRSGA